MIQLTMYEVDEKANPPKNPNNAPKNGMQMPTMAVRAVIPYII